MGFQAGVRDVQLRRWQLDDAGALARMLNDPRVRDWLRDGLPDPYGEEDGKAFIRDMRKRKDAYGFAVMFGGRVVGSIGVYRQDNIHRFTAELGYCVSPLHWGKGIGALAVQKACDTVFQKTDVMRIFAMPFSDNLPSCRVLEKAGFTLEGVLRHGAVKNGVIRDMKLYARLREEKI